MRISRIVMFSISSVLILMACFYAFLRYSFWEPSGIERGSLVYHLKIPEAARDYPLWGVRGVPLYDWRIGDGVKRSMVRISYTSALDLPGLISRAKEFGFNCPHPGKKQVHCLKYAANGVQHVITLEETRQALRGTDVQVDLIGE